jgi:Protein of unknown function (DUF1552)
MNGLPRRTFLKGVGTLVSLPLLESLSPAANPAASAVNPAALPKRMAFVYVPNGANMADWTPKTEGRDFALPYILEPLAEVKSDFCVLSGLTHDKARPNGDGAGDHARASAAFLTGAQPRKTAGVDIHVGVSVDQVVANKVGNLTPFRSLELGIDRGQSSGSCDSGYSCAYQFNIAWRTPTSPVPPETNPRLAFDRLFSTPDAAESAEQVARRQAYRKSVLDFVLEDAKALNSKLGKTDQRKLDEYLTSVRELERRIEMSERISSEVAGKKRPDGIPTDYQQHVRLMYDVMLLAFQTDTTRVASFIVAHDGSNRPYPFIGISEGHHDISHHGDDPEKKAKIAKINRFHTEQFAYFIKRLKGIQEGTGTLLDNCMIVYGSGIADGNAHAHNDLPVLLAGGGGGSITPGRHVRYPKETPMTNLYLSMMDRMGVNADRLGDSTGHLGMLSA